MTIEVSVAGLPDKTAVENLFSLYLHDLSEFSELDVDEHGRFLREGALNVWWEREVLFPFLIHADAKIAGFAFVCAAPHVSHGRDYRLNDFFVLRGYRRRGVGLAAARAVFDRFSGRWEVGWLPANKPAATFWQRTVAKYAPGRFEDACVAESPDESLPGLHFSNL